MPSRRFHKKSRFGCVECKKKRTKCDETRPCCRECTRSNASCLYLCPAIPQSEDSISRPSGALRAQHSPAFDSLDLVLMNHFTAVTSLNLFSGESQRKLWQREIPSQAGSNAMLMHGLLAVAGLDISRSEAERSSRLKYQNRAFYHHGVGLQLFKAEISQISTHNHDVLFTFAILLVIWVFTSPTEGEAIGSIDVLDKLEIVRGCRTIFLIHKEVIRDRPIAEIADLGLVIDHIPRLSSPAQEAFSYLCSISAADEVCLAAVDQLQRCLQKYVEGFGDTKIAGAWPAIVSDSFWARLKAHEPVPIVIFAHYAIILRVCGESWLWMAGWSEKILDAASNALKPVDKDTLCWEQCEARILSESLAIAASCRSPDSGATTNMSL